MSVDGDPGIADLADLLKRRAVSPVELVDAALSKARAARHVFILLLEEQAKREAGASEHRWTARRPRSPLDGIPIAWKDMFDVAGSRTSAGSLTREAVPVADADAPVVGNARALGLITLGKTNLSEFAYSGLGLNPHFGTPIADPSSADPRVPGGSSSGTAIAVRRGIVPAAVGTDTAGSIRVPAAFNGLVGLRASQSRYDRRGVFPLASTLDTIGPIGRTVEDCLWLDAALRGIGHPTIRASTLREHGFVVDVGILDSDDVDPVVVRNTLAFATWLKEVGARVEFRAVEAVARVRQVIAAYGWLGAVEAWRCHERLIQSADLERVDRRVAARLLQGRTIGREAEAAIRAARDQLLHDVQIELGAAALVLPTVGHGAPRLADVEADDELFARANLRTLSITMIGSFLDMPGIALPSGFEGAGQPTSVLISLPCGQDDRLIGLAASIRDTFRV